MNPIFDFDLKPECCIRWPWLHINLVFWVFNLGNFWNKDWKRSWIISSVPFFDWTPLLISVHRKKSLSLCFILLFSTCATIHWLDKFDKWHNMGGPVKAGFNPGAGGPHKHLRTVYTVPTKLNCFIRKILNRSAWSELYIQSRPSWTVYTVPLMLLMALNLFWVVRWNKFWREFQSQF